MAEVLKVRLTVITDVGEYSVDVAHPQPGGGNPAFVTAQLASAVDVLGRRAARILEAEFGPQHVPDVNRLDVHVHGERCQLAGDRHHIGCPGGLSCSCPDVTSTLRTVRP